MLAERRHGDAATRQSQRIQSTHGGFDGPYGTKGKTVWTQEEEGRTREGQASKRAHRNEGKEGQTRREAQSHAQSAACAQEDGAQGAGLDKHGDTSVVAIDGDTPRDIARRTETGDVDEPATAAAGISAAATASALAWRVDSFLDAILGAEAVGELVLNEHAAKAARQQLEQRLGWWWLVEPLAPEVGPSP